MGLFSSSQSLARRRPSPALWRQAGQSMVEFGLVAPMVFLVFLGIVIVGIAAANQNLLTNAVRDTARSAAVCGGSLRDNRTQLPAAGSTPAQTCSWDHLDAYAQFRLSQLAGHGALSAPTGGNNCKVLPSLAALVCLYDASDSAGTFTANPLDGCTAGSKLTISAQYAQPLFLPLVGNFLGNNGSTTTRSLSADAEATCEQ